MGSSHEFFRVRHVRRGGQAVVSGIAGALTAVATILGVLGTLASFS
ncbi:hypothetical protein GS831_20995 [Rhodococcus hoagii]|nr:hypothetical protein [Prescottella equi]